MKKKLFFLTATFLIMTLVVLGFNPIMGATTTFEQGSQYDQGTYDLSADQPTAFNWSRNSRFASIDSNPYIKWQYIVPGSTIRYFRSSPAIASDGTVYSGNADGKVYAFNKDGTLKWTYSTDFPFDISSPIIGQDGTIFISNGIYTYALNPNGTLKWSTVTSGEGAALDSNGILYVLSSNGRISAINSSTGTVLWRTPIYNDCLSEATPAIGADGTIYFTIHYTSGSSYSYLFAYYPDGTLKWQYQFTYLTPGYTGFGSPTISQDGSTIYLGSTDFKLYAFNNNGTVKWTYTTNNYVTGSPVVDKDGSIYFGSWDGYLYALNTDGSLKWKKNPASYIVGTPIIDKNGNIIVAASTYTLINYNSNGDVNWSLSLGTSFSDCSPAIGSDGTIYLGASDRMFAIGGDIAKTPCELFTDIQSTIDAGLDTHEKVDYARSELTQLQNQVTQLENQINQAESQLN